MNKLHTFASLRRAIKGWLKAGVMEDGAWFPTEEGSPQGGICSPLLANVALHGLEEAITSAFPRLSKGERWQPTVVRYADDFVVLHPDQAVSEQAQRIAASWLAGMGLELKPSKTHLTHTLHPHEGQVGFDFLGFHIRQYPVGQTHSGKGRNGRRLGFKTIITPSPSALRRHQQALKATILTHEAAPQAALIAHLNPLIRGWAGYYAHVCAKRSFTLMDTYLFGRLWYWAKRRHPTKSGTWRARTYWHPQQGSWHFATPQQGLLHYRSIPIRRYVKVQGTKSPFDGDWFYWTRRQGSHPDTPPKVAYLLKRQQGRCACCGLYFIDGDRLEIDHVRPTVLGGRDNYSHLQLLHRHCHDQKTAADGSVAARGTDDSSQAIEEPDEVINLTSGSEAERRGQPRRLG